MHILWFEQGISCILQGCSDQYAISYDTFWCIIWYMYDSRLRFEVAHHLLADVGRPALSRQGFQACGGSQSRVSSLGCQGRLGPVASECHVILRLVWVSLPVSLRLHHLSQCHWVSVMLDSARSLSLLQQKCTSHNLMQNILNWLGPVPLS